MIAATLAVIALAQGGAATVQVEPLPFDPSALRALPLKEFRVTEKGASAAYKGIPLRVLLKDHLRNDNAMADLRDLTDAVVLLRASDGYQTAVSAAEVAMDEAGDRFLLAFERDGKPLGEGQGPARLIVPGDPKPVRWIREIKTVVLVRLPKPR